MNPKPSPSVHFQKNTGLENTYAIIPSILAAWTHILVETSPLYPICLNGAPARHAAPSLTWKAYDCMLDRHRCMAACTPGRQRSSHAQPTMAVARPTFELATLTLVRLSSCVFCTPTSDSGGAITSIQHGDRLTAQLPGRIGEAVWHQGVVFLLHGFSEAATM